MLVGDPTKIISLRTSLSLLYYNLLHFQGENVFQILHPCKKATGILARSPRDSRRVLPRFWPPGFPFSAVNSDGILAGLPSGSRRDYGSRDFAFREPRRDLGGIVRRDFGRRDCASRRES